LTSLEHSTDPTKNGEPEAGVYPSNPEATTLTTSLTAIGDKLAVVLDRSTLEALGIDERTQLEVSVDDTGIRIRPAPEDHRARVLASARRMMDSHDATFRKLAE